MSSPVAAAEAGPLGARRSPGGGPIRRHPRTAEALRWALFLAAAWLVLWPALTITISGDDLLNPFYVFADYGPSPLGMWRSVSRDLTRQGHFNHLGQNLGAIVFVGWAYLIGWGVRFSLLYAVTKFVVIVLAALAGARLLRTLAATAGRDVPVWRSRVVVALALLTTLQIHVAWSADPVASFPLSGYLAAAVGLWALDLGARALADRADGRSAVVAAAALCVAILYYEINVAVAVALAPIVVLRLRSARAAGGLRAALRRAAIVLGPPALLTVVLQGLAARASSGYTGTEVVVGGDGTPTVLARTVAGSLPASAWPVARDWLGEPVDVSPRAVAVAAVAAVVLVALLVLAPAATPSPAPDRTRTLVAASVPLLVWLVATGIQAATAKVRTETVRVGYVYNYYAYGSIGVVLVALLLAPLLPAVLRARGVRVALVAPAVAVVLAQAAVNGSVQRAFDDRLRASDAVVVAFSERAPEPERCAALEEWAALPFWQPYYRTDFVEDVNRTYRHFHGEAFCSTLPTA